MKRKSMQFAALLLSFALLLSPCFAATTQETGPLRVGLFDDAGTRSFPFANLENNTGYGKGYRYGYFDSSLSFVELGYSEEGTTAVSMVRTSNVYLSYAGSGSGYVYSQTQPAGNYETLGCYHIVLPQRYGDFTSAARDAQGLTGAFVAWISGEYQVRVGAYWTGDQARSEMSNLGLSGTVAGTSAYAVNVVKTGTTRILFQFDGGQGKSLGIMPDVTGAAEVRTWFKGYRYHGGFRYERLDGGDLTVVNILPDFETYVKGVIPYEMSNNWPLEALKAQAVAARTYGRNRQGESKHTAQHFDICNSDCCQVYRGVGTNVTTRQANAITDRAVEETAGLYLWYDGIRAETYYSSSHGGGSEDIYNVWGSSREKYPYLCGVVDPYEQQVADRNNYSSWTRTFTKSQLNEMFKGYNSKVNTLETIYSNTGNVIKLIVRFENNETVTLGPTELRRYSYFGLPSIRFAINGEAVAAPASGSVAVNENRRLEDLSQAHILTGGGAVVPAGERSLYTIDAAGRTERLEPQSLTGTVLSGSVVHSGNTFVFQGSGWGHSLGMSQFGAMSMAQEFGLPFDEILTFYYPGTYVSARG